LCKGYIDMHMVRALSLACTIALLLPTAVQAQRVPPISGSKPQSHKQQQKQIIAAQKQALKRDLANAKAAVKRGKPFLKRQQQTYKLATRNMMALQRPSADAFARVDAAKRAYDSNPNPQNLGRWQVAYADYLPKRAALEAAIAVQQDAGRGLAQRRAQMDGALQTLKDAQTAKKRGPAFAARPVFAQFAALPAGKRPAGYEVVQQSSLGSMFGQSPPAIQRTNNYASGAVLGQSGPRFVPAAVPAGAALPDVPASLRQRGRIIQSRYEQPEAPLQF
jgi:hypothetical protein